MKNKTLKNYIIRVIAFTLAYTAAVVVIDIILNSSFVTTTLYDILPYTLYRFLTKVYFALRQNLTAAALVFYIIGFAVISLMYVFRLNKILAMASNSVNEEKPAIFEDSCPDELRDFSRKLREFKYDLKTAEQARQLAEQQKNDLVVYLAHDLKTPLTSVIGYLTLLEEAADMPAEQRAKFTGIALDKAYRLEQLINEFFDITRLNLQTVPTEKASVNLTVLILQILSEFYPMFNEKNMRVVHDIEPELVISADSDKLARVFDNLFRNAVNYGYNGTDIVCTARKTDGYAVVTVQNSGDDIAPSKLERIFDKFYRADNSRHSTTGGAGLGLAIAKQIVEAHGGTIAASCNAGVTVFTVRLPL